MIVGRQRYYFAVDENGGGWILPVRVIEVLADDARIFTGSIDVVDPTIWVPVADLYASEEELQENCPRWAAFYTYASVENVTES